MEEIRGSCDDSSRIFIYVTYWTEWLRSRLKGLWKWKWKLLSRVWLFAIPCIVHGILQVRILEWVACPFSRGSSWPRNQTRVSCIAGKFFTSWAVREALKKPVLLEKYWKDLWINWKTKNKYLVLDELKCQNTAKWTKISCFHWMLSFSFCWNTSHVAYYQKTIECLMIVSD